MYFWIYIIEIIYRQLYNKRNYMYGYSPITDYQESEVRYEEIITSMTLILGLSMRPYRKTKWEYLQTYYRRIFYMEKLDNRLILQAINEIAEHIGFSIYNPISLD